ncbi:MAG: MarC family protein [Alphaproteobacteria bacterium]|nr:MarC family protein [Alphaproteobacteria bacterium]
MYEFAMTAFATLFVIVDPIGQVPIFMALTHRQSPSMRKQTAFRAIVLAGMIMLGFALTGEFFLRLLGISLPAFRIAGGILLLLVSIDMILARQSGIRSATEEETEEAEDRKDVAIIPLAIPLIAGPGAITSVILLMGQAQGNLVSSSLVLLLILVVLLICLIAFLFATRLMTLLGVTGVNVVGRLAGIVLAALAVQFLIDGIAAVIPKMMTG